jgi:hypothetical protein
MQAAEATSDGVRATAPATRRAAELGVDLASLATGELVTVRMVEAAAANGAPAPPPELPLPLDAPSGVERVAVIGAGFGASQVIDIFATDASKRDGWQGFPSWAARSSWSSSSPKAISTPP